MAESFVGAPPLPPNTWAFRISIKFRFFIIWIEHLRSLRERLLPLRVARCTHCLFPSYFGMALLLRRVGLCAAVSLGLAQAFLPSASLPNSPSSKQHGPSSRSSVAGGRSSSDVRGGARSVGRSSSAGTVMSGGENDLYVVGAGYLG